MFENMDINQLQEQYMDLTGADRIACMRELARRFRDGIGIDVDTEEAEAWEKEADEAERELKGPQAPAQQPEKTAPVPEPQPMPDMSNWDNNRIYQAYQAGDPYATAQFAARLAKAGEVDNAQAVCRKLIERLEEDFTIDPTKQLLPQAKLLSGNLYARSQQPEKARLCYEEAACELNYRPAVLPLVNCYLNLGAKRFERELKPLLAELGAGTAEEKLVAADGYQKLGSGFEASIHLENVAADPQATSAQRFKALRGLRAAGRLKQPDLDRKIAADDPYAMLLLAQELAEGGKLDEAEQLLSRIDSKPVPLDAHQSQILHNLRTQIENKRAQILQAQQEEAQRIQMNRLRAAAAEQRRIQAQQERLQREERQRQKALEQEQQRRQEAQQRQQAEEARKRKAEEEKKARLRWLMRIPLLYIGVIALAVAGLLISGLVDLLTLKKIDVFEEIEVVVEGAAPYASVEVFSNSADPFVRTIHFSATPESDLRNGDTIIITANVSKAQAKEYGYRLADSKMKCKLKDIPSYITDISDLKSDDVDALFEKIREAVASQKVPYRELILDNDKTVGISEHLANNVDNIELLKEGYTSISTFWDVNSYTIFTMKADLLDCEFSWYLNEYYEDGLVKDFKDVYFYFVFGGLTLDSDGNLIREGNFSIDQSHVFQSKSAMEQDIRDRYDDLAKGKVKN